MFIVQYHFQEHKVWLDSNKWDGVVVTTLWSTIWSDMDPYLRTPTQIQIQNKTSVSYKKSRQGDVACRSVYNKMQKVGLFKGNKPRKKSILANSNASKMLAKKKVEGNERVRLRCDAAERKVLRLAEEEQQRRKHKEVAHARSETILGQMTDAETHRVQDFIQISNTLLCLHIKLVYG